MVTASDAQLLASSFCEVFLVEASLELLIDVGIEAAGLVDLMLTTHVVVPAHQRPTGVAGLRDAIDHRIIPLRGLAEELIGVGELVAALLVHRLEGEIDHRVADGFASRLAGALRALVEVGDELIRLREWIRTLRLLLLLPALLQAVDARADGMECRFGSHGSLEETVAFLPQLAHAVGWNAGSLALAIVGTTFVVLAATVVVADWPLARGESTTDIAAVSTIGAAVFALVFLLLRFLDANERFVGRLDRHRSRFAKRVREEICSRKIGHELW